MNKPQLNFGALPKKMQILIVVLAVIAIPFLCWSFWHIILYPPNPAWLILAGLALATIPFSIFLPSIGVTVSFGQTFLMAIALLYGPSACVVATAFYAVVVVVCLIRPVFTYRSAFNFSIMLCEAFLYSSAFLIAMPTGPGSFKAMLLPIIFIAVVSFLFGTILTATAESWVSGKRISVFRAYLPLLVNSFLAAGAALIIAMFYPFIHYIPLAIAPIIGLAWGWTRVFQNKLRKQDLAINPA